MSQGFGFIEVWFQGSSKIFSDHESESSLPALQDRDWIAMIEMPTRVAPKTMKNKGFHLKSPGFKVVQTIKTFFLMV